MKTFFLLTSIIISFSSLSAETYFLKSNSTKGSIIQVEQSANSNGFYNNGIHKDTGTNYNPLGYDNDGFDINGLSEMSCSYDVNDNHIEHDGRHSPIVKHNGTTIGSTTYTHSGGGYETDEFLFTLGNLMWSTSYWNQKKYEICVQLKK